MSTQSLAVQLLQTSQPLFCQKEWFWSIVEYSYLQLRKLGERSKKLLEKELLLTLRAYERDTAFAVGKCVGVLDIGAVIKSLATRAHA